MTLEAAGLAPPGSAVSHHERAASPLVPPEPNNVQRQPRRLCSQWKILRSQFPLNSLTSPAI